MTRLPDPTRSWAVLIGTAQYRHLAPLPAVHNNLVDLRQAITAQGLGSLYTDHTVLVEDPQLPGDAYSELLRCARRAEDTLIVYFAGHGLIGPRNELYLALGESNPDELWFTSLPYEQVRAVMSASPAQNRIIILDCCFSGRAITDMGSASDALAAQAAIEGTYTLTATGPNRAALAPRGERHTTFTGALLKVMQGGLDPHLQLLPLQRLFPMLSVHLTSRSLPQPRQQGSDTVTELALVRNAAYRSSPRLVAPLPPAIRLAFQKLYPKIRVQAERAMAYLVNAQSIRSIRDALQHVAENGVSLVSAATARVLNGSLGGLLVRPIRPALPHAADEIHHSQEQASGTLTCRICPSRSVTSPESSC